MTPKAQANNNKNNKWDVIKIKTFYASQVVLVVINYMPMQETQETQVQSLGQEDPLEEGMQPTPVFLPRESHGQRGLEGYGPWGHQESDTTEVT